MNAAGFAGLAAARSRIERISFPLLIDAATACVQFCIFANISFAEAADRSLMWDFAVYYQAFYEIAHGRLDAFESLTGLHFINVHANFLMWPLALAGLLSSAPVTLKLISDAAAAAATFVALCWARDIVRDTHTGARASAVIAAVCAAVALLNPWTYQSQAFDFHFYAICALAAAGLGRALYNGATRSACGWMLLGVAAGDVSTTIAVATAFGLALAVPKARRTGLVLATAGSAVFAAIMLSHFVVGNEFGTNFAYLKDSHAAAGPFGVVATLIEHPGVILAKVSAHADALYANLSPSAFLGLFCPLTALPIALVLFENLMTTNVHDFIWPGNENAPAYYLLLPGLAWALAKIARSPVSRAFVPVCLLAVLNCAGWFWVWFPLVEPQWIRVSPATSAALDALHARLRASDEVIASDHFVGSFVDRDSAYDFRGGKPFPIRAHTYVALSTRDGTGPNGWNQTYGGIAALLRRPDARLVSAAQGLWLFEFPQASARAFAPPASGSSFPAVVFTNDVGRRDFGRAAVESDGRAGYLVRDAIWRDPPGSYAARIGAVGPIVIEAWDASRGTLLARTSLDAAGIARMPFVLPYRNSAVYYTGEWIFRCGRQTALDESDRLELRVATARGMRARVLSVALDGDQGLQPTF